MSQYAEKIKKGEVPSEKDWTDHLIEAHKSAPGMTPKAFAHLKTTEGKNSYQLLADAVANLQHQEALIIDLACGDGYLVSHLLPKINTHSSIVGIDMSEGELRVARNATTDSRVSFSLAAAQSLPLENQSVDHMVCHMAFMLMAPLDPVVKEIARVLKPDGSFSAVIGKSSHSDLFAEIQKMRFQFIASRYPKVREAQTGDPRVGSLEGLNNIFRSELGFQPIEGVSDFDLQVSTAPEGIWDIMETTYFIGILSDGEKFELKEKLIALGRSHADSSGRVSIKLPMRLFNVRRK